MDTDYIFQHRDSFTEKPSNYEEIVQICEMIPVKDNGRRRKQGNRRRDRVQAVWQEDDPLMKSLNFVFNKLSAGNLDIIFNETIRLLSLMLEYPEHLEYVIHDIFTRGIKTGYMIELYVRLFKRVVGVYAKIQPILVKICEYLFYTHFHDDKLVVVCEFVSQMYVEELVSKDTLLYCIDILLEKEKYFEFCSLLEKHIIELQDLYKGKLDALFMSQGVSNKVKFKITDIYDLLESL